MISEDHVTLKTGVMAVENTALPSQGINDILKRFFYCNNIFTISLFLLYF